MRNHFIAAETVRDNVMQAARQAGAAQAMFVNLTIAGMPHRAEIWRDEQAIWEQRRDDWVRQASLRRTLGRDAIDHTYETFQKDLLILES